MISRLVVFTYAGEGSSLVSHAIAEGLDAELAVIEDMEETLTAAERQAKPAPEAPEDRKRRRAVGRGAMPTSPAAVVERKLMRLPAAARASTFLFFDMNVCFAAAERLAGLGFMGNFPTEADRHLEADRAAGKEFVAKHYPEELQVAENHEFSTAEEGIEFLGESEDLWVLKGYSPDAPTVVPDSDDPQHAREQLCGALERRRDCYEDGGYLLERKIAGALELTPQVVYYDGVPVYRSLDIELKRKGAGDTGLTVGCAANLIVPLEEYDRICSVAFPPVVDELARDHRGMFVWDASVLIDPETGEMFYGEFCSNRCGYDALFAEIEMSGGVRNYLEAIVARRNPFLAKAGFSVRVFNDHLDSDHAKMPKGDLPVSIDPEAEMHAWTIDVRGDEGALVSNGYMADLLVVSGAGATPDEAIRTTYQNLLGISFEGAYYRPEHDICACAYPSAIMNRYRYGVEHGLFGKEPMMRMVKTPDDDDRRYEKVRQTLMPKSVPKNMSSESGDRKQKRHGVREMVGHTRGA